MKYFSFLNSHHSSQKGFTLIELMVVLGIFAILVGISTVSLSNIERTAALSSEANKIVPDLKEQQVKAMSGDSEGSGTISNYGIHFEINSYTLFRGSYVVGNTENFVVNLASNIEISTGFSNAEIIFLKGSGNISNFNSINVSNNFVTFTDSNSNGTQTILFNKYGVITSVL